MILNDDDVNRTHVSSHFPFHFDEILAWHVQSCFISNVFNVWDHIVEIKNAIKISKHQKSFCALFSFIDFYDTKNTHRFKDMCGLTKSSSSS